MNWSRQADPLALRIKAQRWCTLVRQLDPDSRSIARAAPACRPSTMPTPITGVVECAVVNPIEPTRRN